METLDIDARQGAKHTLLWNWEMILSSYLYKEVLMSGNALT